MTANQEIIAELRRVLKERDEAQARVIDAALIHAELVRERDEARAKMELFRHDFESRDRQWGEECLRGVSLERRLQEARAEVERLRKDSDDAYRRGAEAMREACAREASVCANHRGEELDAILSALPIPEEP
jgi:DNA repair exonuclease SbcCD ATPase subunit